MADFLLYSLHEPDTGAVRYVGKSAHGENRLREHRRPSGSRGQDRRAKWLRSLRRDGLKPACSVIARYATAAELDAAEVEWIAAARAAGANLTNLTSGGDCGTFDAEARAKISASLRGRTPWNKGKPAPHVGTPHTEETKQRLREIKLAQQSCKRGHPLSGENVYLVGRVRHCRMCKRDWWRRSRAAETGTPVQIGNVDKTHCKHGHEFTPENTIARPNGSRNCRACMNAAVARYEARKRQERATQ